jgi:hypothetical protein
MIFSCWVTSILKIEIIANSIVSNQHNIRDPSILSSFSQAPVVNNHTRTDSSHYQISLFEILDSFEISIDNCASRCITNQSNHFIVPSEPLESQHQTVQGINKHKALELKEKAQSNGK